MRITTAKTARANARLSAERFDKVKQIQRESNLGSRSDVVRMLIDGY